ncbi:acetoacetyl-coenzyme A synthetase [Tricharina praecox]|uniref:acetoacetyl-coenzyme A synthetase n=1 Tax=Tricharina praecox TaxID=43433 RepID=UPI00221F9832|nr:acetoacetyl-coenzyme A synthetase [Tricharina praecox]KAI5854439.1 acetoacetyl-coenzyme A synthetase [Tricharina praecox]
MASQAELNTEAAAEYEMPRELWRHPDPKSTNMEVFRKQTNARHGVDLQTSDDIHKWSVDNLAAFWGDIWENVGMIHEGAWTSVVDETARIDSIPDWFPGVKLNFTELLLFTKGPKGPLDITTIGKEDDKVALTSVREGGTEMYKVTWGQLRQQVGHLTQALRAHGVRKGDRVAGVVSNSVDALAVFLATVAIGAIYSSSATDMGAKGVLDRMLQIEPMYIFMDDYAVYNRKKTDLRPKMTEIVEGMESVKEFKGMISLPRFAEPVDISAVPRCQTLATFMEKATAKELILERVPFRHPFFIAYSSGTTGKPKCIVHCGGGSALNMRKEQWLHHRVDSDSTYLQYTTTGWIMYLVQVNTLLVGAHVVLYDGSPFQPGPEAFIRLMGDLKVTHLGSSPKYFQELQLRGFAPRELADLSNLRVVTSTGMVLSTSLFEWFYDVGFPPTAQLSNITGGTDINGALAIANTFSPLYAGGCHGLNAGIATEVYALVDSIEGQVVRGRRCASGEPGELVVTKPFPTMPVMFWGKEGAKQYFNSYFAKYDNVWTQGDFAMIHPRSNALVMLGRADGVLNPSGVRFGSSELYSVLDAQFSSEIADSIAVGQRRPKDLDEQVVLFLLMKPGQKFTPSLVKRIKAAIGKGLSKRHVPRYIFETPDIPTTINFKKVELPVKQILCGKRVVPSATLRNPESLEYYYQFVDIERAATQGMARL